MFRTKKKSTKTDEETTATTTPDSSQEPPNTADTSTPAPGIPKDLADIEHDLAELTNSEPDISAVSKELSELEQEVLRESKKSDLSHQVYEQTSRPTSPGIDTASISVLDVTRKIQPKIKDILPLWIEKPIYWITPNKQFAARYTQWLEEWGHFILIYMTATHVYVLALRDLVNEFPFKNPLVSKTLTLDQLTLITDYLETKKKLQYLDPKKTRARIYWQSFDETADELFTWALQTGHEYISFMELLENDLWNTLPEEQMDQIFQILIRKRKAIWADQKERKILRFEFPT